VVHRAKNGNTYGILAGKPKGRPPLGSVEPSMKDNNDTDLNTGGGGGRGGTRLVHSRDRSGCCEHGDELSVCVSFGNV
jgi:hypothetical protein